ncbi:mucin-2-like [Saccostrea cucullata]|uniref:mucin-2-like n=1 Tax=Saccostrea cuccullata TaxID=36930 RepID=UPI002ED4F598
MNYFIGDDSRYNRDIEGGPSFIKQATRTKVERRKPSANNARDKKKAGSTSGLTSMIVFTSILIVLIIAVAILAALFVNERTKSTDKKSEPLNKNSSSVSSLTTKIISTPKEKSTKMTTTTAQETKVKTTQKATSAISFTSLFPLSIMSSKTSTDLLQPTTATSSILKGTTTGEFHKSPQTSIPETTSTEISMPITTPTLKSSTKAAPTKILTKSTTLSSNEPDKASSVYSTTKFEMTSITPKMISTEVAADDVTSPLTSEAVSNMSEITTKVETAISTTNGIGKTSLSASSIGETTADQTSYSLEAEGF